MPHEPDPKILERLEVETLRLIADGAELEHEHILMVGRLVDKRLVVLRPELTEAGLDRLRYPSALGPDDAPGAARATGADGSGDPR